MKILTVVGARPQFIKAAVMSIALKDIHEEVLVHTGQHYDHDMSDIFFQELNIPKPDYNLGISGGSHGDMTGKMIISLEKVMAEENPDLVLLYGDTNSTLAAAIAAAKLFIPICHIEAGVREAGIKEGTFTNPEEINRIVSDKLSTFLMCCTKTDVDSLKKEGMTDNVYFVGDIMLDAFLFYSQQNELKLNKKIFDIDNNELKLPDRFYYLTCHREENTRTDEALREIMFAMNELEYPTIYPVHPRNSSDAIRLKQKYRMDNLIICKPVGYLMSLYLICNSEKVVTDSGGLQREAFFAEKQCVTIADDVAWADTLRGNRNQLAKANKSDILKKLHVKQDVEHDYMPFGDGHAAKKVVNIISGMENKK